MAHGIPTLTIASGAAAGAAEISGQAGARTSLGITDVILQSANSVRVNKRAALALSERVQEMATTIAALVEDASMAGVHWDQLAALQSFESMLEDIRTAVQSLAGAKYLMQVLHERRDRDRLLDLSERVRNAFTILMMELRAQAQSVAVGLTAKLDALADKHDKQLAALADSLSEPHARLPPRPPLHLGRDAEMQALVAVVTRPAGRATVLGGPGMGKTTLAVAVAHHPSVIVRFGSRRFFVACDAAEGQFNFLPTLAAALGITGADRKLLILQILELLSSAPTLLLLDNFESAWEAEQQRGDAEELLGSLGAVENLALVLTLRGAERPGGVHWTRPLLRPLEPLTENDSRQIFASIADSPDPDSQGVSELLSGLDNVPLAVVLMANLAQVETIQSLLHRWRDAQTAMLVRGSGQRRLTSLDISIGLSVHSPRMQAAPMARRILSLLSLLPHGAADTDVPMLRTDSAAVSALLQTALAVRRGPERIFVLAPIRSYMLAHHSPRDNDFVPFSEHYFGLAETARHAVDPFFNAALFSTIVPEVGNIEAVVRHALNHSNTQLRRSALQAVNSLAWQYRRTSLGAVTELFPLAMNVAKEAGDDVLHADFLLYWARIARGMHIAGDIQGLLLEAKAIYERIGHAARVLDCRMILTMWCTPQDMLDECRRVLAESQATDDHRRTGRYTIDLAEALQRAGQMPEAAEQAELGIALLQRGGPASGPDMQLGAALMRLGQVYHMVGPLGKAIDAYQRSLEIFEAGEYGLGATLVHLYLAYIYLMKGEPRSAVLHAARSVHDGRHAPSSVHGVAGFRVMAEAHAMLGNVDEASDALARLEHTARVLELTGPEHCDIWNTRGLLAMWRGDLVEARMLVHTARSLLRATNDNRGRRVRYSLLYPEANYLVSLATIELEDENHLDAFIFSLTAALLLHRLGRPIDVTSCLVGLAEAADDVLAARLLDALFLPLQRMERSYDIAMALLRSATIAEARGEHGLAAHRARNALRRFGDIKDARRIDLASRLAQAAT